MKNSSICRPNFHLIFFVAFLATHLFSGLPAKAQSTTGPAITVTPMSNTGRLANCWKAVSAGYDYTLALKNDGTVWAWGDNGAGQLGDGTTTNRSSPIQVPVLSEIVAVSAQK